MLFAEGSVAAHAAAFRADVGFFNVVGELKKVLAEGIGLTQEADFNGVIFKNNEAVLF